MPLFRPVIPGDAEIGRSIQNQQRAPCIPPFLPCQGVPSHRRAHRRQNDDRPPYKHCQISGGDDIKQFFPSVFSHSFYRMGREKQPPSGQCQHSQRTDIVVSGFRLQNVIIKIMVHQNHSCKNSRNVNRHNQGQKFCPGDIVPPFTQYVSAPFFPFFHSSPRPRHIFGIPQCPWQGMST